MSDDTSRRLDVELVRRGLAASRAQAREAIEAGKVAVDGAVAGEAGQLVTPATPASTPSPRIPGSRAAG